MCLYYIKVYVHYVKLDSKSLCVKNNNLLVKELVLTVTLCEWITSHSSWACAYRVVVFNLTMSSQATRVWTGIITFLIYTCFGYIAFTVHNALGSASWRRPNVIWKTRTYGLHV